MQNAYYTNCFRVPKFATAAQKKLLINFGEFADWSRGTKVFETRHSLARHFGTARHDHGEVARKTQFAVKLIQFGARFCGLSPASLAESTMSDAVYQNQQVDQVVDAVDESRSGLVIVTVMVRKAKLQGGIRKLKLRIKTCTNSELLLIRSQACRTTRAYINLKLTETRLIASSFPT